ncbi:MAG: hypothetical protein R2706_08275 [Acidimicrobiales bacterium]
MPATKPVTDWADDYDIFDAEPVNDPYPIWRNLRDECPVPHTDRCSSICPRHSPRSLPSHDTANFSSVEVTVAPVERTLDEYGNESRSIIDSDA